MTTSFGSPAAAVKPVTPDPALHHYDQLGLLSPAGAGRAPALRPGRGPPPAPDPGLRSFGLPLAEISELLDGSGPDPRRLLRRQLDQVEERIAAGQQLRQAILAVLGALTGPGPSTDQLTDLIERMLTMDRKLTGEQLEQLIKQRRQLMARLTPEQLAQLQQERAEATAKLTPAQLADLHERRRQILPDATPD
jgi:MerR family transcriptional regulator, thiopeptide resistance regulator